MAKILGWFSAPTTRTSCSKRRSRSASWAKDGGKIFTATSRRKRESRARYTSPIPPAPRRAKISYGPSFVPEISIGSLAALGISPAGSRFAYARKTAQVSCQRSALDPSLRSGFRLRAPASLTPAKRLKFRARDQHWIPRCARDFACGLPLRSRPQNGSSFVPEISIGSLAALGISPAGSRFAHARKTAQVSCQRSALDPSLRSGFRLRAPASLTPAKRLKFRARDQHWSPRCARDFACGLPLRSRPQNGSSFVPEISIGALAALGISPAGSRFAHAHKAAQVSC